MPGRKSENRMAWRPALLALALFASFAGVAGSSAAGASNPPQPVRVAAMLYSQPPKPTGGILLSSLRDPDGSAADQWVWDGFIFSSHQSITEIRWRGAYDPARLGSGGRVVDFTVDIYPSNPTGAQPDVTRPPLVHYEVGGNAGEAAAEVLDGVQTYDYRFVLPAPFEADAQKKYWLQIEAYQANSPDWGLSAAGSGDGAYFRRIPGQGANYQLVAGDAAFALFGPLSNSVRVHAPLVLSP